jgi:hypothetical protein
MVAMGTFPFKEKFPMAELGIEPGTSWSVVRNSYHYTTRLVTCWYIININHYARYEHKIYIYIYFIFIIIKMGRPWRKMIKNMCVTFLIVFVKPYFKYSLGFTLMDDTLLALIISISWSYATRNSTSRPVFSEWNCHKTPFCFVDL